MLFWIFTFYWFTPTFNDTMLKAATYDWFSAMPDSTKDIANRSLDTFLLATCSIPFNNLTNTLYTSHDYPNYELAASVLSERDQYGSWSNGIYTSFIHIAYSSPYRAIHHYL